MTSTRQTKQLVRRFIINKIRETTIDELNDFGFRYGLDRFKVAEIFDDEAHRVEGFFLSPPELPPVPPTASTPKVGHVFHLARIIQENCEECTDEEATNLALNILRHPDSRWVSRDGGNQS
jgi:hypothetical protein